MEKVPGITYIEASLASLRCPAWQERTVADLARLDTLAQRLPPRFHRAIADLRGELPIIFGPSYPLVLGHGDLCEMNILVDPEAGGITGIIDWAEAMILPFGMSLWGLLSMLGTMDSQGWHYHANASQLESVFWEIFYENAGQVSAGDKRAIIVAERAGLLLRYGFTWENGLHERPVTERDSSFGYLDAFLPRLQG
ncbi:predicted protein [Aspergillus terreus NIH2624]|uniref:Aminoglycoside phosphotransferase domain-containing protein n=1 Tax=Aspergillus terreus (strain NIH 2624 / FGSC A1156) TaxID=341663 RepID=Q0CSN5_ASPTN|nr:uncharacterized protein ATEG_03299 [Aspergillus terreus NIH2624]EAU36573.1 predicted protein [Aspergillus terreus NIH2624]